MHSDHRNRYHIKAAVDVFPGDRVSTDVEAIAAVVNEDPEGVDWAKVEQDSALIQQRFRPRPTSLRFDTTRGELRRATHADLLVIGERSDGTAD